MSATRPGVGGSAPAAKVDALLGGKAYLESLRDGREVYIYGERVKARSSVARSIAA